LASDIVDRTHTMHGSGIGAASAAISTLGLDLDLSKQRVLMRMRSGARHGAAALAHGWPEPGENRRAREKNGCKAAGSTAAAVVIATGGGTRRVWSTLTRVVLFIGGSTGSARCRSFRCTMPIATDLFR
jgi:hypothetical protein